MRPAPAAPATLPVVRAAAAFVAAALLAACATAQPTPTPPASPGPTLTSALPATAAPGALPSLVTWERRGPRSLLVARGPAGEVTAVLPESANGPPASAQDGRLAFASGGLGGGIVHVGSLANGLATLGWTNVEIPDGMVGPDERLRWVCLGPAGRLAAQTDAGGLLVVEPDGAVRPLERHLGVPRPGGCAWADARHLLFAVEPRIGQPGLVLADVDSDAASLYRDGGDAPAASDGGVRVAYVRREGDDYLVLVGGPPGSDPAAPDAMPPPGFRISAPLGGADRPILSADGSLLGVTYRDDGWRPVAVAVYALGDGAAEPQARIDVAGADDAAIVWLLGVP